MKRICLLALILLAAGCGRSNPRRSFEQLITEPIPDSVLSIEESAFRGMDSVFRVLQFKINAPDLRGILDSQGFVLVKQDEVENVASSRDDYFIYWERRILEMTGRSVRFTPEWQAYTLKEQRGQKFILCNTNNMETVFVEDIH